MVSLIASALLLAAAEPEAVWQKAAWSEPKEVGNYNVTVRLGDENSATENFVKFQGRRLASDRIVTKPGEFVDYRFTARVPGPYTTRAKDEASNRTLDILVMTKGAAPSVQKPSVEPAPEAPTIYLMGDSTVTDQKNEPYGSWGQILPAFVKPGWSCSNFARSGLALKTADGEGRLVRVLEHLKAGDWVVIQFGHNDQKIAGEEPEAGYTDRQNSWIDQIAAKGGKVVLVTPVERRRFADDGTQQPQTLKGYADAVKAVAAKRGVPFIDLNAISYHMMGVLGAKGSAALQCQPGRNKPLDNTHHNIYGAYVHARTIAAGLAKIPVVGDAIRDGFREIDPDHPAANPRIPASGNVDYTKPEGS